MTTLPSLNRKHRIGLLLVLATTGASLLLDASAKQTAGIVLLGLAVTCFVGSVAVRTLAGFLSVIAFCAGLYVAVLPVRNERESVFAMVREYDATLAEIQRAAERNEEYERIHSLPPGLKPIPSGAFIEEAEPLPPGATLAEPIQ